MHESFYTAEGMKLRREIAAAEYELQRLSKSLKRRKTGTESPGIPAPPMDSPSANRSPDQKELTDRIAQLQGKLNAYKQVRFVSVYFAHFLQSL